MGPKRVCATTPEGDILSTPEKGMLANPHISKFSNTILGHQTQAGCFRSGSALIYNTFFFVGMLHELGAMPHTRTIEYLRSLQAGKCGFSESPGQVPWTDKTVLALKMFDWLGLVPREKNAMGLFFRQMQNKDGGFGSVSTETSNTSDTLWTLEILDLLDTLPDDPEGAFSWVNKNMLPHSVRSADNYARCLSLLGRGLDTDKGRLKAILQETPKTGSSELEFHRQRCIGLLGLGNQEPAIDIKESAIIKLVEVSPSEAYYALLLLKKRGCVQEPLKIIEKILGFESEYGGFLLPSETYTIKNAFCAHSLYLLGAPERFDRQKFIDWLKQSSNEDGWGAMHKADTYTEYTATSLNALSLLGEDILQIPVLPGITHRLHLEFMGLSGAKGSNYNYLRTSKNILELSRLLGTELADKDTMNRGISSFHNPDGGFGNPRISYIYATYWAVRSLYLLEPANSGACGLRENPLNFKIAQWLESCSNADGGFGPMPGEPSCIQATYLAVSSMAMLGWYPKRYDRTFAWVVENMEKQDVSNELLNSLYLTGVAAILYAAVNRKKIEASPLELDHLDLTCGYSYAIHIDLEGAASGGLERLRASLGLLQQKGVDYIMTSLPRCVDRPSNNRTIFSDARVHLERCKNCVYSMRSMCRVGAQ